MKIYIQLKMAFSLQTNIFCNKVSHQMLQFFTKSMENVFRLVLPPFLFFFPFSLIVSMEERGEGKAEAVQGNVWVLI